MSESEVAIERAGAEAIDEVEPLWEALRTHQGPMLPVALGEPRDPESSWELRRRHYAKLLAEPQAFLLIARRDGRAVGYAMVNVVEHASHNWPVEHAAMVETLSVLPGERGGGIGGALMDRVRAEITGTGATHLMLGVVAGNDRAMRFYERHGFTPAFIEMAQRL